MNISIYQLIKKALINGEIPRDFTIFKKEEDITNMLKIIHIINTNNNIKNNIKTNQNMIIMIMIIKMIIKMILKMNINIHIKKTMMSMNNLNSKLELSNHIIIP